MWVLFAVLLVVNAKNVYNPNEHIRLEILSQSFTECISKSGVKVALANKWLKNLEFPNDPCFKCFLKCEYLKANFMYLDGSQNIDLLVSSYAHVYEAPLRACENRTSNILDLCQRAYEVGQCIVKVLLG